jgi:hypothetical protein
MKPHVKWGIIPLFCCWPLLATSIVIRSDGKQIAIAADSKSIGEAAPFCKIRVIRWGVVVVGGFASAESTFQGKTTHFYDALPLGVEAANGLTEPWRMVDRFTVMFEPKAQNFVRALVETNNEALSRRLNEVVTGIRNTWGNMLMGGEPIVQIAFAVNHNGNVAFYRRQFFTAPIFVDGEPFITYRDESCPGTCTDANSRDAYTAVGIDDIRSYIGVHPEMFSKSPLEFSTFFVRQVMHDFSSMVGEPITTLTLDAGDHPWNFHDIAPCEAEAQKATTTERGQKK